MDPVPLGQRASGNFRLSRPLLVVEKEMVRAARLASAVRRRRLDFVLGETGGPQSVPSVTQEGRN